MIGFCKLIFSFPGFSVSESGFCMKVKRSRFVEALGPIIITIKDNYSRILDMK